MSQAIAQEANLAEEIKTTIERVQQTAELTDEQRQQAITQLDDAEDMLANAQEQQRLTKSYKDRAASAAQKVELIRQSNQKLRMQDAVIDKSKPLDKLENQLLLQRAEQKARLASLANKQSQQTILSLRANKIAEQLSATRADATAIDEALANETTDNLDVAAKADYLEKRANARKLAATITAFWADSSSPEKISFSALVTLVLHRLRIDLFLSRLLSATRTCF